MQKSSFDKWLLTLALVAVIAGAIYHFVKSAQVTRAQNQKRSGIAWSGVSESYDFHPSYVASVPRPTALQLRPTATSPSKISREKIEAWLAKYNRNAKSLLAAFRVSGDTNYLNEAATNFPNNPQVELAVLVHDEFPADRRKWLDLFKASSPSNSLANYLSAENDFKNGNTSAAVQELLAASGKSQFEDYTVESESDEEQLAEFSGKSPLETYQIVMAGIGADDLPEMETLKRIAYDVEDLQKHKAAAGDTASVQNLAQMGMVLGNELINGGGGKLVINQLNGIADEALVLSQLDQNSACGFLGNRTPAQVLQQNGAWKASVNELEQKFLAAFPQLTQEEKVGYYERLQTHGGLAAIRWAVQQRPPSNP